jgi:hypothetical protein
MRQMKKVFHCDTFIETGTLGGATAFCASPIFSHVLSVELSESLFASAQKRNKYPNVSLYCGSSDLFLDQTLPTLQDRSKLFWLDAHYSCGNTATLIDEKTGKPRAPIMGELSAIFSSGLGNSVVLIDDISGYLLGSLDMRYPHLHFQYQFIKNQCDTAKLWVIGDLALVYDTRYHNPTISPIVQACTISRMFDWYTSTLADEKIVLRAERDLVARCHESEADRICYLSGYCHCRDYRLWRGLIHLGRRNFVQAAEDFQYVLNAELTHWRVNFYLAYALTQMNAVHQAQEILLKIKPHLTDHELFFNEYFPF